MIYIIKAFEIILILKMYTIFFKFFELKFPLLNICIKLFKKTHKTKNIAESEKKKKQKL